MLNRKNRKTAARGWPYVPHMQCQPILTRTSATELAVRVACVTRHTYEYNEVSVEKRLQIELL